MGCRQRSKKLFFDVATPPCSAVCPPFYLCRTITTFSHQSPPTSGATITARCLCQPAGPKRRSALTCWALAYLFWPLRWYSDLWKKMLIFAKKSVNKKREDKFKTNTFFHKIRNLDCYQNFKWRQIRKIVFFWNIVIFENLLFSKTYCFWKFIVFENLLCYSDFTKNYNYNLCRRDLTHARLFIYHVMFTSHEEFSNVFMNANQTRIRLITQILLRHIIIC